VRPAKARGQNFLVTPGVADKIVSLASIEPGDEVLEIGPGLGILTERIAELPVRELVVVELDARLAERLADRFTDIGKVRVINMDFLEIDLAETLGNPPLTVIGNLPFNVAGAILRRLSDNAAVFKRMVLMFQREVAERIRALPGEAAYSALTVYTALYWRIDSHFTVAAGSFHPRPKVDAEVLRFAPLNPRPFEHDEERAVLAIVRASFAARRKTIRNSLTGALAIEAGKIGVALELARITPTARAQTLGVADFIRLARALRDDLINLDSR
jgi:16S rRNA (adenine1518-N6/adenine1519-N6)-dimethyltransferase